MYLQQLLLQFLDLGDVELAQQVVHQARSRFEGPVGSSVLPVSFSLRQVVLEAADQLVVGLSGGRVVFVVLQVVDGGVEGVVVDRAADRHVVEQLLAQRGLLLPLCLDGF